MVPCRWAAWYMPKGENNGQCGKCEKVWHSKGENCPATKSKCNTCNKVGHCWGVCRNRKAVSKVTEQTEQLHSDWLGVWIHCFILMKQCIHLVRLWNENNIFCLLLRRLQQISVGPLSFLHSMPTGFSRYNCIQTALSAPPSLHCLAD